MTLSKNTFLKFFIFLILAHNNSFSSNSSDTSSREEENDSAADLSEPEDQDSLNGYLMNEIDGPTLNTGDMSWKPKGDLYNVIAEILENEQNPPEQGEPSIKKRDSLWKREKPKFDLGEGLGSPKNEVLDSPPRANKGSVRSSRSNPSLGKQQSIENAEETTPRSGKKSRGNENPESPRTPASPKVNKTLSLNSKKKKAELKPVIDRILETYSDEEEPEQREIAVVNAFLEKWQPFFIMWKEFPEFMIPQRGSCLLSDKKNPG